MIREEATSDYRQTGSYRSAPFREAVRGVDRGEGRQPWAPSRRTVRVLAVLAVSGLVAVLVWTQRAGSFVFTDDALITAHIHPLSARVAGVVEEVRVDENQRVRAGETLVLLDRRDGEAALRRAAAALAQARAQATQGEAAVTQAQAQIEQREADVHLGQAQIVEAGAHLEKAQLDFNRNAGLFQQDVKAVAKAEVDGARERLSSAQGAYDAARANLEAARAAVTLAHGNVKSAEAALALAQTGVSVATAAVRDAELSLAYTAIAAPVAGRIAKRSVETGQPVAPGDVVLSVVEESVWIVANLKEGEWERVHMGQRAEIELKAWPHHRFQGRVSGLLPGASTPVVPPPSDPLVKAVPRLPVKISFDRDALRGFEGKAAPGLAAAVRIDLNSR